MRKNVYSLISVFLIIFLFIIGCKQSCDGTIPDDLITTIDNFYKAIENNATKTRIEMFSNDAMMLPNHWISYKGKKTIEEVIKAGEEAVFKIRDRKIIDIDVSGDLAYTVNSYFYTYHPEGDKPQWHKTKNVHIWKKVEGLWKLHVDIWNSDVPINQFSIE